MSSPPVELKKKSDEFYVKWRAYVGASGFDEFVEFAVSLSSFSAFLHGKGLSGLHQISHGLEQQVLALFEDESSHQIEPGTLGDLSSRIEGLRVRVSNFIDNNQPATEQRRVHAEQAPTAEPNTIHHLWLVGSEPEPWHDLIAQLAYFGIHTHVFDWTSVPTDTAEPAIVLIDATDLALDDTCRRIQGLRARFSATDLIAHSLRSDFDNLKAALAAGCDFCFTLETPEAVIMAKIIEVCGRDEDPPYRVLVVEDSWTASKSIRRTLEQSGIESFAVTQPNEVLLGLRHFQPDLILMDMYMPGCTGVEATRVIRQHAEFLSTPVVYLSGDSDVALQVDALRLGGDHFLTKPFNPVILNAVVKSKIERYRTLRRSMLQDSLTGLLNHLTSKERLVAAVKAAEAGCEPLSVAMIDIDHFKSVNDNYGHPMGDQVIRSLAWLLKQRLRKTDLVGRYGGEEFIVILPGSNAEQGLEVLDRIRRDFAQIKYPYKETWFGTTFSAGLSQFPSSASAQSLIKDADDALFDAKRAGRNQLIWRH
ncbi:diguanylate cyclase [Rhodoferax sp.]|uniref:GGDEF domain-containing response regulator n=1 Tax=Rhodoferax sp. TaxID=50421 RepID=UPI00277B1A19|nr:diguanylate cyclase [Rhodoferax sp.]